MNWLRLFFAMLLISCQPLQSWQARSELKKQGIDPASRTAFIQAASTGSNELVALFIQGGMPVDVTENTTGNSALLQASTHGHKETVLLLIENGADTNLRSRDGYTAFMADHLALDTDIALAFWGRPGVIFHPRS